MKYAVSFFGVLVLIIGGMLFFQYQVYSDKIETGDGGDFSFSQEIEITYRSESLDIRQHFKNLPNQKINIVWPKLATNPDCFIETENTCKRLSEDKLSFEPGENRTQSISYIIPLNGGLQSNQLLKDIFVTLTGGEVTYSTVHISTDHNVSGQWVTGLPIIGQQSLSLVNYSMFSGLGSVSELYWRANNLNVHETSNILSLYSEQPLTEEFKKQLKNLKFLNEEHIAIVQGDNLSKLQGNRILFLKDLSIDSLNNNVILSQVKAQYKFKDSPSWLSEVVASFLTESTIGSSKATEIVNTLTHQMTDSQLANWIQKLDELKGKEISTTVLDEILSDVFGLHTEYLSLNESSKEMFPFLFNDEREVYIGDYPKEDVQVIFKNGLILYSADTLLSHLGYETSNGENGYYVTNNVRNFRFPQDYGFYVFNERRYNTVSEPIIEVAGNQYIEESWLQKLFTVEIKKSNKSITIRATAQQ
ncbi:RNA polymerase II [Lysinibacillus antri]|uniref:RNA polymerase II n=1 Tax=Lysinibacillus antri TaxID=2498145 RepID=A0A432LGY0_9BACI|nr:RNA polymerase II [Lysinibacillus antri]RUL55926.1 RNA polymerase II [Lysinibacillus antri]